MMELRRVVCRLLCALLGHRFGPYYILAIGYRCERCGALDGELTRSRWARFRAWLFEGATRESIREGIAGLCLFAAGLLVLFAAIFF